MDFTEQTGGLPPPLLPAGFDAEDFDYDAFIQAHDDFDYLAEDSSGSNSATAAGGGGELQLSVPLLPLVGASPSPDPTSATVTPGALTSLGDSGGDTSSGTNRSSPPKQRLERRGHTKSRRGCFNCKRRRIKCQENRPACGHCVKTGLKCEYPAAPMVVHQPRHQIPIFTMQDMRFFQHFLFKCYPHHPLNNDGIWTHEVPCLSQEYDYLMHAVLGLAASDLTQDDPSLVEAAMSHRLKAIKAVKKALADAPRRSRPQQQLQKGSNACGNGGGSAAFSSDEGNALLATCFALTFQSVLLEDGMAEYMTFIRGIIIVAIQMYAKGARFLFTNFIEDEQDALLRPLIEQVPMINRVWAEGAIAAVAGLSPLVTAHSEEEDGKTAAAYHAHLATMAEQMLASPFLAYKAVARHYGWWMQLPHDRFRAMVGPDSQLFTLLAAHWI
ncbi:hypothetical protein MAPG_08678, partial [Magnaporthiopsis poae ATCC 64411]